MTMAHVKIYGVCDSGYTTPFIQEVEARETKHGYVTDGRPVCFGCRKLVQKKDAALSAAEAQRRWTEQQIKKAEEFEERARALRERAPLKMKTVPA